MITFYADEVHTDVFPHPQLAGRCIPDFYKKLNKEGNGGPKDGTAKRCIPFMEAMTSGYIIPLWADMYVTANNGDLSFEFPNTMPMEEIIGNHEYYQLKDHPASGEKYGKDLLKFINPWIIETPPGVSCLFTSPMNHFENRFKLIDGIVDTDTYYSNINFPFMWKGGDGTAFFEKGTPLVQVIPFVRYNFNKHKVKTIDHRKHFKSRSLIGTAIKHGYKRYFWHKRKK